MTTVVDGHLDHLAHLLERVPDHLERVTWSREQIAEAQAMALRSLLSSEPKPPWLAATRSTDTTPSPPAGRAACAACSSTTAMR